MTICLGVVCDEGKKIVLAADRMLTGGDVEFEQETAKIDKITDYCAVLSAGSALHKVDLVKATREELKHQRNPSVLDVVSNLKSKFSETRRQRAEELFLIPIGLTLERFINFQERLAESLVLRLTHNIESESLGLSFIVAGVDSGEGHLYHLYDPGTADCFDAVGFLTIGSGERHAELAFIRAGYSPVVSLNQALFLAYQAKRDAEVAPGVGARFTDIAMIDDKGFRFVSSGLIEQLRGIYTKSEDLRSHARDEIRAEIDSLRIE